MKIGDIDKNLAVESKIGLNDVIWFDSKDAPIKVYGLSQAEKGKQFLRFPAEIAEQVSPGVK